MEFDGFRRGDIRRFVMAMQQRDRVCDARNESAHRKAVAPLVHALAACSFELLREPVGLVKRQRKLLHGNA